MSEQPRQPTVLFLLCSLATGGSELKTVRLANALASRGIRAAIAHLDPPFSLRSEAAPQVELIHLRRRGKLSLRALRLLTRTLRGRDVHTVVAVNPYPALYARLALLTLSEPRPRFVAMVNTTDVGSLKLALQMRLYRRVLRRADLVIFGAEAQRSLWCEKYRVGTDARRARVIYNGVDTDRFAPAASEARRAPLPAPMLAPMPAPLPRTEGAPSRPLILGTVGQMRPEKSQVDLVRATALLRSRGFDVRALIVGDGPERPRIEAEIARLGMASYVMLAGEARDVRPALACVDVFVLTSTAVETFSNAALEALACGIPVVASQIGGARELLAFGGGVTYPPGDVAGLCEQLGLLLLDPERRTRMGADARRAVVEHFSFHRMVQEYMSVVAPRAGAVFDAHHPPVDGHDACEVR